MIRTWCAALLLAGCAAQTTQMEPCPTCNGKAEATPAGAPELLVKRAAFDLQCDRQQLKFAPLEEQQLTRDPHSWGAAGCGKQATYVLPERCAADSDCTWLMNGPIQSTK